MSDEHVSLTDVPPTDATEDVPAATTDTDAPTDLGEPGKKALREEREARKTAERELRELRQRMADYKSAQNKTAEERAELERQREIERNALSKANERILKAEVRAAAADKLSDPTDALRFLDLSQFDVADDGAVDSSSIQAAIGDLLDSKPYLAKRDAARFQGSADSGPREKSAPSQITSREELARLSPAERLEAYDQGRLKTLLGN